MKLSIESIKRRFSGLLSVALVALMLGSAAAPTLHAAYTAGAESKDDSGSSSQTYYQSVKSRTKDIPSLRYIIDDLLGMTQGIETRKYITSYNTIPADQRQGWIFEALSNITAQDLYTFVARLHAMDYNDYKGRENQYSFATKDTCKKNPLQKKWKKRRKN